MRNRNVQDAWVYHNETKHSPESVRSNVHFLDWANRPLLFKIYPDLEPMPLPRDMLQSGVAALSAIATRGVPEREGTPSLRAITSLLYFSAGVTRRRGEILFRAAACTGALYEVELYLACQALPGLDAGLYDPYLRGHYTPIRAAAAQTIDADIDLRMIHPIRTGREILVSRVTRGPLDEAGRPTFTNHTLVATTELFRTGRVSLDAAFGALEEFEKRKGRLDPPPRDNPRERPSYLELRDLVTSDVAARKTFLTVRWKGRPSGLGLLCQLLSAGSLTPEVDTDGDYLEAELEHLDKGRAERKAKDGQWKIGNGWTIVREVAKGNVRSYRANGKSGD